MSSSILVIGGTRYFGLRLVERLLQAGHRVTLATRGRAVDPFGERVQRLHVDRRNPEAMRQVFGAGGFRYDLVYDQMCYSPDDAASAVELFAGRVGRYLMSSTIEVYEALHGWLLRPYAETDIDLAEEAIVPGAPWQDADFAARHYGRGKRQAEAVLHAATALPAAMLRLGHVLGGPEDFTGRLSRHVQRVRRGEALHHAVSAGASSFLTVDAAVDALLWAGKQDFRGPLNIALEEPLSAPQLHRRIAARLGLAPRLVPEVLAGEADFDYAAPHQMDPTRARALGWRFDPGVGWLERLIDAHDQALSREHQHAAA